MGPENGAQGAIKRRRGAPTLEVAEHARRGGDVELAASSLQVSAARAEERFDHATAEALLDDELIAAHRRRALTPDRPVLRGTAQNPDVFFQAREACSPFYAKCADVPARVMDKFAALTGRQYKPFQYVGDPNAERVAPEVPKMAVQQAERPLVMIVDDSLTVRRVTGGVIVVNTSLINRLPQRTDVTVVPVPANEVAIECGSPKAANMVTLGAYLGASGVVELDQVKAIVTESFAAKPKLVEVNHAALSRGFACGQAQTATAVR